MAFFSSRDLGHLSVCTQIQLVQLELEARLVDDTKLYGDKGLFAWLHLNGIKSD